MRWRWYPIWNRDFEGHPPSSRGRSRPSGWKRRRTRQTRRWTRRCFHGEFPSSLSIPCARSWSNRRSCDWWPWWPLGCLCSCRFGCRRASIPVGLNWWIDEEFWFWFTLILILNWLITYQVSNRVAFDTRSRPDASVAAVVVVGAVVAAESQEGATCDGNIRRNRQGRRWWVVDTVREIRYDDLTNVHFPEQASQFVLITIVSNGGWKYK